MKNRQNKIKTIAVLLTMLLTAAALFGCSSPDAASEPQPKPGTSTMSQTENSIPESPEPDTSEDPAIAPYLGAWILGQTRAEYTERILNLYADGTADYDGATYSWSIADYSLLTTIELELIAVNDPTDTSYRDDTPEFYVETAEDGTIYLNTINDNYFHEDYLAQFDKVTLTTENVCDYIEVADSFSYNTDALGQLATLHYQYATRFKEGVGLASWCAGKLTYDFIVYEITVYPEPGTEVIGDVVSSRAKTSGLVSFQATSDCDRNSSNIYPHFNNADAHQDTFWTQELTGADVVIGVVYVPKA